MRLTYGFFLAGLLVLVAPVLGVLLRRRYAVITVRGSSMLPTLADGDRVLVRRIGMNQVQAGDVVLGDNRDSSFDSRSIGYIPADRLLGVMMRRMVSQRSLGYCA